MKILVGLGNPGDKYARNRHNVGFMALDVIADHYRLGPWRARFQGLTCEGAIDTPKGRVKVLLLKPQTFYNDSGNAVRAAVDFYKSGAEDVTVFHDELDLTPGKFRFKRGGGHGGNNGLRSTIAHLGPDIQRGRIGIGHPGDKNKVTGHVLSDFAKAEEPWRDDLLDAIARAIPLLLDGDVDQFQTKVTHLAPAPDAPLQRNAKAREAD
ncbi:aminoacyl-tRNA hydrolase [Woodsholea maritima]|uniref:aminoacyl-tRNA hydrolase n=1 Tax=Woodsholea maritima TaxID=240237 RepID=UPI00039CC26D|nr:aminoacyl-tRNA hydrolase [Woodsholea maritima]